MRRRSVGIGIVLAVAAVALAATAAARTTAHHASPVVIGWAFDSKGAMAPFDGPALAAAELRVKQWNAKGGVSGRQIQIRTCDTQSNKPPVAKACALKLLGAAGRARTATECLGIAFNRSKRSPSLLETMPPTIRSPLVSRISAVDHASAEPLRGMSYATMPLFPNVVSKAPPWSTRARTIVQRGLTDP